MKHAFKTILTLCTFVLLSGCQSFSNTEYKGIKTESYFHLHQAIKIAPNTTRTFIQNGKVMNKSGFNRYAQHCRIEVKELKETVQVIAADKFKIKAIVYGEEMIALNAKTQQIAMNQYATNLAFFDSPRVETMDLIHLILDSEKQKNVYRLTCAGSLSDGSLQDSPQNIRPGLKDINDILGKIGQIEQR